MKKKRLIGIAVCVILVVGFAILGNAFLKSYFRDKYAPNTWVNGIYVTGRNAGDVNQELLSELETPEVTVVDADGASYAFNLADADLRYDYSASLEAYQKHQTSLGWANALWQENQIVTGEPSYVYEEEKLKEWWEGLPVVQAEKAKPVLKMELTDAGYVLVNTLKGHLDVEQGLNKLVNAVSEGMDELSLKEADCYFDYEMDAAQKKIYETWTELKELEQCGLTYDMGAEKIVFDEGLMSRFIAKDSKGNPIRGEDGRFYYDLEAADAYMAELCEQYHTYGVERPFQTSRETGEVVMIKPGNYGTELNATAEIAFLREVLSDDSLRLAKTVHTPTYLHETAVKGLNDIGGTYIEVDIAEQKVYFYKDYELMITSGVVTGNVRTRHSTPEGAFCIQGKYKNRVLRGPGYASFVRRWMPVYKSIGLHDANWRKEAEFGGETYLKNGSHGCVNMPDETTDVIFELAEIGTPVLIFQ